jgi:hypothetical protein
MGYDTCLLVKNDIGPGPEFKRQKRLFHDFFPPDLADPARISTKPSILTQ